MEVERGLTRVVCISRSAGAEGERVGQLVAERLGFRYLDEEIVARAAARGGVDVERVADAEQRRSLVRRVFEELAHAGAVDALMAADPLPERLTSRDDYQALIREAIEEAGGEGECVIVAHAASHALAGRDGVLRIHVTGSPDVRAGRLGKAGVEDPPKRVREEDAARASYLRQFYEVDRELPTHYDLVINTDQLTPEQAAALIVHAAQPA